MFQSKKFIVIIITTIVIVAIVMATNIVRKDISKEYIEDFKQQENNILNYPSHYEKDAFADKNLLIQSMRYDDNNYEAPLLYAEALHKQRQYDEALIYYKKAINASPDSINGYWYRSQCYAELKMYGKAIADMKKCIELDPKTYSYYFTRARLYSEINNHAAAIKDYDEIINREDNNNPKYLSFAMVLNNKANSLIEMGKFYDGLPLLNRAIQLNKNEDVFWCTRGELYYAVKDYDKSYNDFNRAIKIIEANKGHGGGDDSSTCYYYRGLLHARFGLMEAARVDLQKAVDLGSVKAAEPLHQVEQVIGKSLIENI